MRKKQILMSLIILCIIGITSIGVAYYYLFYPNTVVTDNGIVFIHKSGTVEQLWDTLQTKGYIKNRSTLKQVALLKKYDTITRDGRFKIRNGMGNNELINMLRSGMQEPVRFVFNNIRSLEELAKVVEQQLSISAEEFLFHLRDPEQLLAWGFTPETCMAMFIPNTYEVYWNISADQFLQRMHKEYLRFWNEERMSKASAKGLTPVEANTLASIIEEETTKREEYPVIAGVYLNRLERGMTLGACPTLRFALGDYTLTRILIKHTQIDSPYNTYKHTGLPPGPIRITSIQVVDAVLNAQKHDYLFFCAKSDFSGYHHFARTFRQHSVYAQEYHRELDRRGIY